MLSANVSTNERKLVYRRDGFRCTLCDSTKYIQLHHIIKRSQGGSNSPHNLITLCADCHALAHGMNLQGVIDANQDTVEQAIVEYMADLYACQGEAWNPWEKERGR